MNSKFSLKVVQQGQAQKVHVVTPGAGLQGQALVVQAKDAARYQLADIVTLSTPEKLQMKRVGGNLHIALPGGDVDAPDIVIEDYYNVRNATVQGQTVSGEWRGYTTANLVDTAAAPSVEQGALNSKGWFSQLFGNAGGQSVGTAGNNTDFGNRTGSLLKIDVDGDGAGTTYQYIFLAGSYFNATLFPTAMGAAEQSANALAFLTTDPNKVIVA